MVKIYKTDIVNSFFADYVVDSLLKLNPGYRVNFDLDDCDNILRIEAPEIDSEIITAHVLHFSFVCVELI